MTKQPDPNSAKSLLIDFYNSLNKNQPEELRRVSPNFSKECAQINNLKKKGYSPEQIRVAFDYLSHRKVNDLRYLNSSIEDALTEKYYWDNRNIDNTVGNIVKYFYNKLKVPFNRLLFLKECKKVDTLLQSYTPYELKRTIDYMKKHKVYNFNFLEYNINNALLENQSIEDSTEDLKFGIKKIENNVDLLKAKEFYLNKTYFNSETLTPFEYAYLVNLPLDENLIKFGLENNKDYWRVDLYSTSYSKEDVLNYLKQYGVEL